MDWAEWIFPLSSIGTVHFRFKGSWVLFVITFQILIEQSVRKLWQPGSDATFCGI